MQHTQFVRDGDVFCPVIFHWFEQRFRSRDTRPCFILFRGHQIVRKLYTGVQNITQWDPAIISTELRFLERRFICDSFILNVPNGILCIWKLCRFPTCLPCEVLLPYSHLQTTTIWLPARWAPGFSGKHQQMQPCLCRLILYIVIHICCNT